MSCILVAEDDLSVGEGLRAILEAAGHKVVLARTGPAAVRAAANSSFDTLLTDLDLPGFDGYEVISQIQALRPAVPVVVLSGAWTVEAMRLPEGTKVLHKPERPERILAAVDRALAA